MVSLTARLGLLPAVKIGNAITAGIEKVTGKKYGRQTTKELASTKLGKSLGIATTGAAVALGTAVAPNVAAKAVGSLIPKSGLGKLGAIFIGGSAAASPTIRKAIIETPSLVFEKGEAIGVQAEKENPEGKGGKTTAAIIGAAAVGLLIPSVVGAFKGGKDEIGKVIGNAPLPSSEAPALGTAPLTPPTMATEELNKPRRKSSKKRKEAQHQTISQVVNVRVSAGNRTNKFIKNALYA